MRAWLVIATLLSGCGPSDEPSDPPHAAAPVTVPPANPLIGVWARISGSHCRLEQVEFTASEMTAETSAASTMRTVPVRYDLADLHAPVVTTGQEPPLRFRIIDEDHLGDGKDCILARAD